MTHYLELDDLLHIAEVLSGRTAVVRDAGQLAAAVARPRAVLHGTEVYGSVGEKAAAMLVTLATTKALTDGNKRLAWVAARLFCAANGAPLRAPEDDAVGALRAVAFGDLDVPEVAALLGAWMTPGVVGRPG